MSEHTMSEIGLNNDVQIIRDILFGEYLGKIQAQIEALEKEIGALKRENKQLRRALDSEAGHRELDIKAASENLEKAQSEITGRLTRFEKQVEGDSSRFGQELEKVHQDIAARLKTLDQRLSVLEDQQGGLVSALASALANYQPRTK